jgi:DinB superfamily
MDPAIATIAPLFRASHQLFHRALDGVSREDLLRRPHDGSNPLIWVAGHAMTSRSSLTRIVGERVDNQWSDIFARGATVDSNVPYPEVGEIIALWDTVTEKLMARLAELHDDDLSQPSPFPVPTGDKTKRGAIVFLNYHETYHIGQMAYLRKWLGYSQLVG